MNAAETQAFLEKERARVKEEVQKAAEEAKAWDDNTHRRLKFDMPAAERAAAVRRYLQFDSHFRLNYSSLLKLQLNSGSDLISYLQSILRGTLA